MILTRDSNQGRSSAFTEGSSGWILAHPNHYCPYNDSASVNVSDTGDVLPVLAANLDQLPADGTQRLVIRPQKSRVIAFNVTMGIISLIGAGAMLTAGSPVSALVCLGMGGLVIYAVLGWHLWVDSERVGVSRFPWGASCRRDQLDRLELVFGGRGGNACAFVRKGGHTAFRVSAKPFGTTQLKALARSLGVPYYDLFSGRSIDIQQPGP